jgi:hypothetical protein
VVNTAFSCLCTLDGRHSFVPRWRPPFITSLAAEDRCHLNGMAMADGAPKYVTALADPLSLTPFVFVAMLLIGFVAMKIVEMRRPEALTRVGAIEVDRDC